PKVDLKTVILFTKQLSVLLKSAVPLLQALELLIEQFEDPFRRIVISIKDGVKSGEPLAKELAKHPQIFTNVYVQLVRAGEASGKLDVILFRLTDYLLRSEETKKKVKKAMATPLMTLGFSLLVVAGLLVGLVPKLSGLFTKMGEDLPMPTVILMALSNFMLNHFTSFIVGLVVAIVAFMSWKSTPQGKLFLDELFLKLPLTAYFTKTKAVVQFSQTLGMLLESGVNLSQALDIVCNIVENKVLVEKLGLARDKIIKEGKIARYLKETGMFPNIASYMISTGEQSGKLADMLLTVGHDYEEELNDLSDGLTAKINPIMTMILGVIVLFIIAAIFLPIMGMGDMAGI
ncbi:MAG: Type II secretion system F domain protein, partial [candidate division TM6 bacterium GW2011_GWF2_38_10]